ncbi:hypothetical protein [Streptomyces sp. OS603R]|uniref:hypothetical protein n=1 Tax=Streptomyces sp. OS603R TaxID=3035287 RepID=UPI0024351652|nr:hypothetical protein [Streptomyces sp. OS603R]
MTCEHGHELQHQHLGHDRRHRLLDHGRHVDGPRQRQRSKTCAVRRPALASTGTGDIGLLLAAAAALATVSFATFRLALRLKPCSSDDA